MDILVFGVWYFVVIRCGFLGTDVLEEVMVLLKETNDFRCSV